MEKSKLTLLPVLGDVLICHCIPPVVGSVCWVITWAADWPPWAAAAAAIVSCTGDGDESGDEVIDVTCGIWISCLICSGDVYMELELGVPPMLELVVEAELLATPPPG